MDYLVVTLFNQGLGLFLPVNFKASPNRSILQNTSPGGGEDAATPLLQPARVIRRRRSMSSISMKIHKGEAEFRFQHASFPDGSKYGEHCPSTSKTLKALLSSK